MAEKENEEGMEVEPEAGDRAEDVPPARSMLESLDLHHLREIIQLCRENDIAELEIKHKGTRIHIRGKAEGRMPDYVVTAPVPATPPAIIAPPPMPAPAVDAGARPPAAEAAAEAEEAGEEDYTVIRSPMVGTFYRAPAPDAAPFVEVGDEVKDSTILCIVEAMKLMNEIKAETRGRVARILVENGQPVEYNQPMFYIQPL